MAPSTHPPTHSLTSLPPKTYLLACRHGPDLLVSDGARHRENILDVSRTCGVELWAWWIRTGGGVGEGRRRSLMCAAHGGVELWAWWVGMGVGAGRGWRTHPLVHWCMPRKSGDWWVGFWCAPFWPGEQQGWCVGVGVSSAWHSAQLPKPDAQAASAQAPTLGIVGWKDEGHGLPQAQAAVRVEHLIGRRHDCSGGACVWERSSVLQTMAIRLRLCSSGFSIS